jgi:predicted transcriptional regulator
MHDSIKHINKYNNLVTYYGQFYTTQGLVSIYMDISNYLDMNEFECTNDINDLISKIKNKLRKEKINRLINENPIEKTIEKKETIIKKKKSLIEKIISKFKKK